MRFKVLISDGEDGWLVVECPSLPGCVSQGRTIEEALENIKDAIQGCLDVLGERVSAQQSERIVEDERGNCHSALPEGEAYAGAS